MRKQTKFTYFLDVVAVLLFGLIPLTNYFHLTSNWDLALLVIIVAASYGLIFLGRHIYQSALTQKETAIESKEIIWREVDEYYLKPEVQLFLRN